MKFKYIFIFLLVLVLVYFVGPVPESPVYSTALPDVPTELIALEASIQERENRPDIKPQNNARIEWANDTVKERTEWVMLYLPGFTASRMEGEPVYGDFAKRYGMNVYAARLAAHGLDTVDQLIDYRPERLWQSTLHAFSVAQKLGDKVLIMSTSTGGTLALKLAAMFPDKVHALINMSPNVRINDPNAWLLNKPWGLQIARLVFGSKFRTLEDVSDNYDDYWYSTYRLEATVYLQELVSSTMTEETFANIICPSLTLYYYKDEDHQDPVVRVDAIKWMHEGITTPDDLKRAVPIPNAGVHVIGCGLYSGGVADVEAACFDFADSVLQL